MKLGKICDSNDRMSSSIEISAEKKTYEPLPGEGQGFVDSEWKPHFDAAGLSRIEDFFAASGHVLSKPGWGKRYRARLELKINGQTVFVFLKRYQGETGRNLLQRRFEDGEPTAIAIREVRVAAALEKMGITTFKPLAWGWQGSWGTRQKSFLVMSQVPGISMERWLEKTTIATTPADWQKKKALVKEVALLARKFHGAGWFHRDFYLCHIFISEAGGNSQFALVDLARVFRPRWRIERWRIKDLAQLNYSASPKDFSRPMRLRFAHDYFGIERLTAWDKKVIRKILKKTEVMARHDRSRVS